jgi:hypothetical protein
MTSRSEVPGVLGTLIGELVSRFGVPTLEVRSHFAEPRPVCGRCGAMVMNENEMKNSEIDDVEVGRCSCGLFFYSLDYALAHVCLDGVQPEDRYEWCR